MEEVDFGREPERSLAGICGIYCGTCPSYLATRNGDTELVRQVAERHHIDLDQVKCDGCLSAQVMEPCRLCRHGFRTCAAEHGITWCFECHEFPCERLANFTHVHVKNGISHHEHIIEELQFMKGRGVAEWLRVQARMSQCPACGTVNYWFGRDCRSCGAHLERHADHRA